MTRHIAFLVGLGAVLALYDAALLGMRVAHRDVACLCLGRGL